VRKLARWGFAAVLLPLAACNPNPSTPLASTVPMPQTLPQVSAQDQNFINLAASSDMFEIQSSRLALQRSRNPATRRFAERMIAYHTQSSQRLDALAQAKGVVLPSGLDPEQQRALVAIDNTRRLFDQEYFRQQAFAHTAAVQAYQTEISSGYDADLRGFAQQTLPIVQEHLQMAQNFRGMDMRGRPAR
jgi:putative membrane protein